MQFVYSWSISIPLLLVKQGDWHAQFDSAIFCLLLPLGTVEIRKPVHLCKTHRVWAFRSHFFLATTVNLLHFFIQLNFLQTSSEFLMNLRHKKFASGSKFQHKLHTQKLPECSTAREINQYLQWVIPKFNYFIFCFSLKSSISNANILDPQLHWGVNS